MTARRKFQRSDRAERFVATQRRILSGLEAMPDGRRARQQERIEKLERGASVEVAGWELDDRTWRNGISERWTLHPDGRIERVDGRSNRRSTR